MIETLSEDEGYVFLDNELSDDNVLRDDVLRDVTFDGYRLVLSDTCRRDEWGKSVLAYVLYEPGIAEPLFQGDDYHCSPCHANDSDEALRSLIGFLSLRPGDTDSEYFESYTPRQLEWAKTHGEELSLWARED